MNEEVMKAARAVCVKWRDMMSGVEGLKDSSSIAAGEYRNAQKVIEQIDAALKQEEENRYDDYREC